MIVRPVLAVLALLVASVGLVSAPSYAADCEGPATGKRGKEPLCDLVVGDREFKLTKGKAKPGGTLKFKASGFVRDEGGGQTLTFKLNDIDIIGPSIEADADGNAKGTIKLPKAEVFNKYKAEYGSYKWWVRVLVGSGRPDGQPDLPAASLHDRFRLVGLKPTPIYGSPARAVGGSVDAKATHLTLSLKRGTASKTKLVVESLSPVPIGRKSRMITVASGATKPKKKVTLKLSKDGKRYFRRHEALYVAAVSKTPKSKAVTRVFKIEKK